MAMQIQPSIHCSPGSLFRNEVQQVPLLDDVVVFETRGKGTGHNQGTVLGTVLEVLFNNYISGLSRSFGVS